VRGIAERSTKSMVVGRAGVERKIKMKASAIQMMEGGAGGDRKSKRKYCNNVSGKNRRRSGGNKAAIVVGRAGNSRKSRK